MPDVAFPVAGGASKRLRELGDGNHAEAVTHATSGLDDGAKTVITAGTAEPLFPSSMRAQWVTIQARKGNTGDIAVGGPVVDAGPTGTGVLLAAGESITLPVDDLADVFIDASVSNEGVRFTYGT